jgi:cell division protein FtsX
MRICAFTSSIQVRFARMYQVQTTNRRGHIEVLKVLGASQAYGKANRYLISTG